MHEIIALPRRHKGLTPRVPFELGRIDVARFQPVAKGPSTSYEHRTLKVSRPQPRLARVERTGLVEKWTHRIRRAGKLRLFRMWKLFHDVEAAAVAQAEAVTRPLGERLAWLRRSRRL